MYRDEMIWTAVSKEERIGILPRMANRHGLIAGATGTGKTITMKVLAESFSDCGVPVFLADVKGDLSGMCYPGDDSEAMKERIASFGLEEAGFSCTGYPVCFWDIGGKRGLPLRTTISEMGPVLLARLLELTQTQSDILSIVFRIADEDGLLLIDTKDMRAMLQHVAENSKEYSAEYGNIPKQSINAILRAVIALESAGGEQFFGEPALDIHDWFRTERSGRGVINILDCRELAGSPMIYSTFMLWMLSELFETLPEQGDRDKPRMIFFFDEAHLLFDNAPKALLVKIEQVVKLVRSKGVGIYFISQNPRDIPDGVLSQLGNRIQHGLRAYTPAEQKRLKAAAQSFRPNPEFDTKEAIEELGCGEALISFLDEEGRPGMVKKSRILPPQSLMGPVSEEIRREETEGNALYSKYASFVDRDSAYEFFQRKKKTEDEEAKQKAAEEEAQKEAKQREKEETRAAREEKAARKKAIAPVKNVARSAAGTIGREVGGELGKKVGGSFGKRLGGNLFSQLGRDLMGTLFEK